MSPSKEELKLAAETFLANPNNLVPYQFFCDSVPNSEYVSEADAFFSKVVNLLPKLTSRNAHSVIFRMSGLVLSYGMFREQLLKCLEFAIAYNVLAVPNCLAALASDKTLMAKLSKHPDYFVRLCVTDPDVVSDRIQQFFSQHPDEYTRKQVDAFFSPQ